MNRAIAPPLPFIGLIMVLYGAKEQNDPYIDQTSASSPGLTSYQG